MNDPGQCKRETTVGCACEPPERERVESRVGRARQGGERRANEGALAELCDKDKEDEQDDDKRAS